MTMLGHSSVNYQGTPAVPGTGWFDRDGAERPKHGVYNDESKYKGKPYSVVVSPCGRCGGAGGADMWAHTGWKCFDCGGSGMREASKVRLFTADEIKVLNERRDAQRAKKAAAAKVIADAKKAAEAARRVERADALAQDPFYAEFKALILAVGIAFADDPAHLADRHPEHPDFLRDMWVRIQHTDLTENQAAAVQKFIQSRKDRIRKTENSRYLGDVGQRVAISGKVVFVKTIHYGNGYGDPSKHLLKIETDDEQSVVWFTQKYLPEGTTLTGKGTIRECKEYKGKRETIVTNLRIADMVVPKEFEN